METVGPQKKILRSDRVYSNEYIRRKMGKAFGQSSQLMESILSKCAEVAEHIIYEVMDKEEPTVMIARPGRMVRLEVYCPHCKKHKIRPQHNYCPECGHRIKWIN